MKLNKNILCLIILVLLSFISYANIISNNFVWDDSKFIVDRPETRDFSRTLESFKKEEYGIYRPLRTIVYYLAYQIFDLKAALYHLFSIFLHISFTIVLFFIIKELFDRRLALLSSALFAVHPIHVERVANATASFDIVGIIFYLLSFYLYILFRKKDKRIFLAASIFIFIIGLFASEEIFTLPLMLLLYEFTFQQRGIKKYLKSAYYFVFLGAFIVFRFFILGIMKRVSEFPGGSALTTFITMPKIILEYIYLVFFPFGLTPFRKVDFIQKFELWFIIPSALIIMFVYLVYKYRQNKILVFFSGWFFITMLPFMNIMPLQKIMAERYFYMASLAVFVLISAIFIMAEKRLGNRSYIISFIFGCLCIFFIALTVYNNTFWRDDYTLLNRGVRLNPYDSKALDNLGVLHFRRGEYKNALGYFKNAVKNDPNDYTAWNNLGSLYSRIGEYDNAINALVKALELTPFNYESYDRLGIVYLKKKELEKAEEMFKTALYFDEEYYPSYSHLGTLYANNGNFSEATRYFHKAISINPYYAEAYFQMGLLQEADGNKDEAKKFFMKAAELQPDDEQYADKVR